jgi:hypothetical protein
MVRGRRRSRRWPWLLAALLLFLGGAWLMSRGERMPAPKEVQVNLPRYPSQTDLERLRQRRQVPILATPTQVEESAPQLPAPQPKLRDPLLVAMPSRVKEAAVVVEANALRHSPIGELLLDCFVGTAGSDDLGKLRSKTGLDVLEDLDRVAVADQTVLVSGRFEDANWAELFSRMKEQEPGPNTRWWKRENDNESVLLWKNQIMVVGRSDEEIRAATDRLEGRVPADDPVIPEDDRYGEIYGVVNSTTVAELFERQAPDVAAKLKTITDQVKLHVDATHDVGIVADTQGNDPVGALDLAKTLGGALALGRAATRAQGRDELAAFLDYASVHPKASGSFRVELALPLEYLKAQLKDCPGRKARGTEGGEQGGQQAQPNPNVNHLGK